MCKVGLAHNVKKIGHSCCVLDLCIALVVRRLYIYSHGWIYDVYGCGNGGIVMLKIFLKTMSMNRWKYHVEHEQMKMTFLTSLCFSRTLLILLNNLPRNVSRVYK